MNTLGAAVLFFGVVFLVIWLAGPPTIKGPETAESCVVFANRIFANRKTHTLTPAEERDLDLCRKP
jgi:hypothetical protein